VPDTGPPTSEPAGQSRPVGQVWGPDALTVRAVAAIDIVAGLGMAGAGQPGAMREGIQGYGVGAGTSFAGDLGPLQVFQRLGHATTSIFGDNGGNGLPASTGASAAINPIQAQLAGTP
jgi:hypothetical protein